MNLPDATAAPLEFMGLTLHPLNLSDMGRFERWAKERVMTLARDSLRGADTPMSFTDSAAIMSEAYAVCGRLSLMNSDGQAQLNTLDGILQMIWMSLRKGDPELTVEDAGAKVGTFTHATVINNKIMEISGFIEKEEPKKKDLTGPEGSNGEAEAVLEAAEVIGPPDG